MSWLYLSNPCASLSLHTAHGEAGAAGARLSLRPLKEEGQRIAQLRRKSRRENKNVSLDSCHHVRIPVPVSRHCEERSDAAIHLSTSRSLDCFASLAMTVWRTPSPAELAQQAEKGRFAPRNDDLHPARHVQYRRVGKATTFAVL